jgi:hypothetical protein
MERLLLEGLDSGPATPMTKEDWADLRAEVAKRVARNRERGGRKASC